MVRLLVATLALAFALVPPGICACRLEVLLFAEASEGESECPDEDGDQHDCDCVRIQQDCITSSAPIAQMDQDGAVAWISVAAINSPLPSEVLGAPAPSRWPDSPPLYLMLRALLL